MNDYQYKKLQEIQQIRCKYRKVSKGENGWIICSLCEPDSVEVYIIKESTTETFRA